MHTGMLPCLVPQWPQTMQSCISFRSRSDLLLDADHSLVFLGTHLVSQACISFCGVSRKRVEYCFESTVSEKEM